MRKNTKPNRITDKKQELLGNYTAEFPYVATQVRLDSLPNGGAPWHWHDAVELFYVEHGSLEYHTPEQILTFPEGSGGLVNADVLHMTQISQGAGETVQILHIFDPFFVGGPRGGVIAQKYVLPIVSHPELELIPIYPENEAQRELLEALRASFLLDDEAPGYEMRLRETLSGLWLRLLPLAPSAESSAIPEKNSSLRQMLQYVHDHYADRISVAELAASGLTSERECYRLFRDRLRCSPVEYIIRYRLQMAGELLARTDASVTAIGHACGFGSSSYFGKLFLDNYHCTPTQYRRRWQDHEIISRK